MTIQLLSLCNQYFQGHGWCNGKVVSYRNYAYQIQFRIEHITTECSAAPAELKRLRSTASIREGACLEVYWPVMKAFKQAVVRRENARKRENFLVSYGDSPAEREWIDLQRHRFRILDQKPAAEVVVPSSISARGSPMLEVSREVSTGSDAEGSLQMYNPMDQTIPDASSSISFSDCAGSSAWTRVSTGADAPPTLEQSNSTKSAMFQTSETGKDDSKPAVDEAIMAHTSEQVSRSSTHAQICSTSTKSLAEDFESVRSNSSTNTSNQSTIPSSNLKCDTGGDKRKRAKSPVEYVAVSPVTRNNLAERRKLKSDNDDEEQDEGVVIDPVNDRATRSLVNSLIAVGSRVSVFLDDDARFVSGTITDFRTRGEPFFISYDDGDEEWIDLRNHKFRILGMGNPRRHSNSRSTREEKKNSKKQKKSAKAKLSVAVMHTAPIDEVDEKKEEHVEDDPPSYTENVADNPAIAEDEKKQAKRKRASFSGGRGIPSESNVSRLSIGSRIAVWWADDEHYYIGSVKKERIHKEPYFIVYDDDDEGEWLDLKDHKFKIMPCEPPEQKKRGRRKKDEGLDPNDVDLVRVGSHVAVWWNNVSQYLKGRITKKRDHEKAFYISYDMGQPGHWIDLSKYTFRLIDRRSETGESAPSSPATPMKSPVRRGSANSSSTDISAEICVGTRVSVYWEGDDAYYEGVVTREKKSGSKRHFLEYDDGDAAHWIDFNDHWVRILHKSGKETPRKREKGKVPASEFDKRCRPKKLNDDLKQLEVGSRVEIWWTGDNCFYRGQITRKSKKRGKFFVVYEDGSDEWVNLRRQQFRLIGDDSSSGDEASHEGNVSDNEQEFMEGQVEKEEEDEFYKYSDFVYGAVEEVRPRTRISVWWTAEKRYFDCVVQEIDKKSRKPYFLVYDDGDEEWTDLRRRYFRFLS